MTLGLENLNLTETPSYFSLMPGETLVRAIRAVDAVQNGLAAGALVSRSTPTPSPAPPLASSPLRRRAKRT